MVTVGEVFRLDLQAIKTTIVLTPPPLYTHTQHAHTKCFVTANFFKILIKLTKILMKNINLIDVSNLFLVFKSLS